MVIVIVDTSGSMGEHGKTMLARNLLAHLHQHRTGGRGPGWWRDMQFIRWGNDAEVVAMAPAQEIAAWPVGGRASARPLLSLLDELVAGVEQARLLLLSDGRLESAEVMAIKGWRRRHAHVLMRALALGPDAIVTSLARVVDPDGVFLAEQIAQVLASWPPPHELPASVAELAAPGAAGR